MLIPRVQNLTCDKGSSLLPYDLTLCVNTELEEKALKLAALLLPEANVCGAADAVITASADDALASEAYELEVADGKVSIAYNDFLGLRNALAALSVAVTATEAGYTLDNMKVSDAPVCSHRGIMLDLARGIQDYHVLCEDLILIAKARLNIVHLHLFDSQGCCMYLESIPASALWEGHYSKQQMIDLVALADVLGLELIPEFDMPAHSRLLLEVHPEYACEIPEGVVRSNWTVCSGTEEVYQMYDKVITELAEIFPGRYMHVGGDELEFADMTNNSHICHWDVCPKCARFRKEHGIADRQDQLYYFTNRINALVKKHGKQTMIWSDQIDCMREVKLDRDILLHFWRIAAPQRGPYEGCSMNAQLSFGFKAVNSWYVRTYLDLEPPYSAYTASAETFAKWDWRQEPECEEQYRDQIIGAEMCCWEYGNLEGYAHYAHSFPSAAVIFADKLWNGTEMVYDEAYSRNLTKVILGAGTPEDLDVFACIGALIPPRYAKLVLKIRNEETETLAYPDKVTVDDKVLEQTQQKLNAIIAAGGTPARRAAAYKRCVQFVIDSRK